MKIYKIKTIWGNGFIEVDNGEFIIKSTSNVFSQFINMHLEVMRDYLSRWGGTIEEVTEEIHVVDK